jgi:hypothetical protein
MSEATDDSPSPAATDRDRPLVDVLETEDKLRFRIRREVSRGLRRILLVAAPNHGPVGEPA